MSVEQQSRGTNVSERSTQSMELIFQNLWTKIHKLGDLVTTLRNENVSLHNEVEQLRTRERSMRDEVEKLRNEIRLLRVDLENKRNEIEDMGKSIQKTENSEYQIQSLKKELELAQRTNSDFQIEIEALRKKVDDAQSEIIQFTKQQQEANELLNKSQLVAQNEERLRTIIEQNDKEIKKLTNELQELKTGNILGLNPAGREEMKVRVRELIAKINSHL